MLSSCRERINQLHTGMLKINRIASHDGQFMLQCGYGDQTVFDRHRLALLPKIDQKFHKVSVDSEGIGWNQSSAGHESSQSTTPALSPMCSRFNRFSPALNRSRLNCCNVSFHPAAEILRAGQSRLGVR